MSPRRVLCLTIGLAFLLFFRSDSAFTLFGSLDPYCYVEHLYHLLGLEMETCASRSFLPGTAILWLPGAALAYGAAALFGHNGDHAIRMSIGFSAYGLWAGSLFLAASTIDRLRPSPVWRSVLWTLSVPVLYYASARTTLSHGAEFFMTCATAWLITRQRHFPSLVTAALACLVRFNALPWLFIVGAAAWTGKERRRVYWSFWGLSLALFLMQTYRVAFVTGYNDVTVPFLARSLGWGRTFAVFFGSDWGLVWTVPWWVLTFVGAVAAAKHLSLVGRACLGALVVNLLLCISWRGNGGDFGYRYLIGTFPAALFLWPEIESRWPQARRWFDGALWWSAPWIGYLTWIYRTRPDLTPQAATANWGAVVPSFQWRAITSLFDGTTITNPLWRTPLASLWCAWGSCQNHPTLVFGAQRWGLAAATALAIFTAAWAISRPPILRRWRSRTGHTPRL